MRRLCVLTPYKHTSQEHLTQTWQDLDRAAGHLLAATPVEAVDWVVQEDDAGPLGKEHFDEFAAGSRNLSIAYDHTGRSGGGPAMARTLALTRCAGDVIAVLDADDRIAEHALTSLAVPLLEFPERACSAARSDDLVDMVVVPHTGEALPPGRVPVGTLLDFCERSGWFPFVGSFGMARTEHARAVGGWPATFRAEDVGLWLAMNELWEGWSVDEPLHLYRRWPGQTTAAKAHDDQYRWLPAASMQAKAIRALRQ